MSDKIASCQQSDLVRALGPIDATMIVMGSMIGSGIFITSAESSRRGNRLAGSDPAGVTSEEIDKLFTAHIDYLIDGIERDEEAQ